MVVLPVVALMGISLQGAEISNPSVRLSAAGGQPGAVLYAAGAGNQQRATIGLIPAGSKQSVPISAVTEVKTDGDESALRITAGGAVADLIIGSGPYVTVKPVKNAERIVVGTGARFVLLPDFFADDTIFDPTKLNGDSVVVPAENFLMQMIEGGDAVVMCIWGNAKDKEAKPVEPEVVLNLAGAGGARRVASTAIEFAGQPVHVGLIEQKGVWHDEDVRAWPAYTLKAMEWKPPFEGKWRGDFIVADGHKMQDWPTRQQSFDFRDQPPAKPGRAKEQLQVWQEHQVQMMKYPALLDEGKAWLCLYADKSVRRAAETAKTPATNVYERVIVYALDRVKNTPMQVFTPVDLMRKTLGQGPCEYVLDVAGIKGRGAGGERALLDESTCGLWDRHIYPITSQKMRGMKPGDKLDQKDREHLLQALEDMWFFVHAVHDRIREYKAWGLETDAWLKSEGAKSAKVKPMADKVTATIKVLNRDVGSMKFEGPYTEGYWKTRLEELQAMTKNETYTFKDIDSVNGIRGLGNLQDEMVSRCRQYVKGLRHELALADTSDPEVRKFVTEMRDRCQKILRNSHPKECL